MDIPKTIREINENPEAFGEIIRQYESPLLRYVGRISWLDQSDAESIVQDVFLRVYERINEYDERWSFSGWIFRIAHNAVIDDYRKRQKRNVGPEYAEGELEALMEKIACSNPTPDQALRMQDRHECVQKAIATLPLEYREAIELRYAQERSYEEISDILRIPIGTASTLINRAKNQLRQTIEKLHCL